MGGSCSSVRHQDASCDKLVVCKCAKRKKKAFHYCNVPRSVSFGILNRYRGLVNVEVPCPYCCDLAPLAQVGKAFKNANVILGGTVCVYVEPLMLPNHGNVTNKISMNITHPARLR